MLKARARVAVNWRYERLVVLAAAILYLALLSSCGESSAQDFCCSDAEVEVLSTAVEAGKYAVSSLWIRSLV